MPKRVPIESRDRFMVTLPEGMRDMIEAARKDSGRTINQEIVSRLEKSFLEGTLEDRVSKLEVWIELLAYSVRGLEKLPKSK